jgi:hypothetical protein
MKSNPNLPFVEKLKKMKIHGNPKDSRRIE